MSGARRTIPISPERARAFVRAWNEGLSFEALRERFGINRPDSFAHRLRQSGHPIERRKVGGKALTPSTR
jgi:hypothetical protein